MNYGIVVKVLGRLLILESAFMMPSLLIAFELGQQDLRAFIGTIILTLIAGFFMSGIKVQKEKMKVREGVNIVTLGWILFSVFGALPFVISGRLNFIDAFFEVVSGFTAPGFDFVGQTQTYANFSALSKLLLSFLILLGRFELYTIIALIVQGQHRERVFLT